MQINFGKREVSCKIVYYGPGMSGKTTNLQIIHDKVPKKNIGDLTSIATEGERTLFFDYMPLDLGKVRGMFTKFQLYTVPGQVYYNSTRKLVLQGVDGVVFVADSQKDKLKENIESLKNLEDNLSEYGLSFEEIPLVIQWNKRDIPTAAEIDFLEENINTHKVSTINAVAATGEGVLPTLKLIASLILDKLNKKQETTPSASTPATPSSDKTTSQPKDEIVAEINDSMIKKKYFLNYCQTKYRLYSKEQNLEDYKKFGKMEREIFLDRMINEYLLIQESKQRGITVSKEEISNQLSRYEKKFCSGTKLESFLVSRNLTKDDARDEAMKNVIINKIVKIMIPDFQEKLKFNTDETLDFYQANMDQFPGEFDANEEKIQRILKNKKKKQLKNELFSKLRKNYKIKTNISIL